MLLLFYPERPDVLPVKMEQFSKLSKYFTEHQLPVPRYKQSSIPSEDCIRLPQCAYAQGAQHQVGAKGFIVEDLRAHLE